MKKKKSEAVYTWKHFTPFDLADAGHYKALSFNLNSWKKTIVISNLKNKNCVVAKILLRALIKSADVKYHLSHIYPAGTATLWQRCDIVVVDVVTTFWQCQKCELWRRQFPTLWQRRCTTLPRRCHNVATTSLQHQPMVV